MMLHVAGISAAIPGVHSYVRCKALTNDDWTMVALRVRLTCPMWLEALYIAVICVVFFSSYDKLGESVFRIAIIELNASNAGVSA